MPTILCVSRIDYQKNQLALVEALRRLKDQYGERLHFYAHDHEAYCLRRHYYDPFRRNCARTYSCFPCRLCAAVTRPQWIVRALTRDMLAFRDELKTVKAFVPATYIKDNLVQNGWPAERVRVLYPLFVKPDPPRSDFMPDNRLRILFMGQLVAGEGVSVLIDAVRLLKIPYTLTVVGRGPNPGLPGGLSRADCGTRETEGDERWRDRDRA